MSDFAARSLVIFSILALVSVVTLSTAQLEVGPFQFFYYQAPIFLLLRYLSAWRISLFAGVIVLLLYLLRGSLPWGVYVEVGSFLLILLVLDLLATSGRAEHRLLIGLSTLLLVSFPLYAFALSLVRSEGIFYCAANAAVFAIPTALSLVLMEGLWSFSAVYMGGALQRYARHEEAGRASFVSHATVAVSFLVAAIFTVFLFIWGNRWGEIITESTQIRADQFANSQLMANRNDVNTGAQIILRRQQKGANGWIAATERFFALKIPAINAENSFGSEVKNPLPDSIWHEQVFRSLDTQLPKFVYRAQMRGDVGGSGSPLYLEVNQRNYPVYSFDTEDGGVLFLIDSGQGTISNEMGSATTMKTNLVMASDYPFSVSNEGGDFKHVIRYDWLGSLLLLGVDPDAPQALSVLASITKNTRVAALISNQLKRQFPIELPYDATLIVQSDIWPRLQVVFRATIVMTVFLISVLLVSVVFALVLANGVVKPINSMLDGFDGDHEGEAESWTKTSSTMRSREILSADSSELHALQEKLKEFAKDAARSTELLASSAAAYENLLGAMPIGVMEVDASYQLRFRNEAMSEITANSAEAAFALRSKAEQLFEASVWETEFSLPVLNESPRQISLTLLPRYDQSAAMSGFWLLALDRTKQKMMDAQLLQTAKLATLGEMSTGMAHELNQPLNIIRLALSNLTNSVKKGRATEESILSRLERMDSAIDRAAVIIDHMRAFGRVAGEDFAAFSMSSSVKEAVDLVREPLAVKGVELVNEVQEPVLVLGNTIQFEQVLLNMINNARDAILEASVSGTIWLRQHVEREQVTLTIEDTGGGIPAEALPHIFEPFYTTKEVGKGTGLGGSISFGIIQDMQGNIWAENTGQGARISIRLPIYSEEQVSSGDE